MKKILFSELQSDENYDVIAFVCDDKYYKDTLFCGKNVYKTSEINDIISPQEVKVISTGAFSSARERYNSYLSIKEKGYSFINYISKNAIVAPDIEMGENNIIFSGVYLDFFGKLGNSNIIRPNTYIGHNFNIKNGVYISPGCNIAGYSEIDDLSFIGIGSTIIERIHIKKETLVGATSLITKDTEEYGKYVGVPAKLIKTHKETGVCI